MNAELRLFLAAGLSLLTVLVVGRPLIGYLRRQRVGQSIRTEGPASHRGKAGIPTMGGMVMILALTATSLTLGPVTDRLLVALTVTLGYGALGLLDDYRKVALRRSLGLRAREKLAGQAFLAFL